jgi:cholesterol oxidase
MERAYDAVVVGSGFGGGIAACRLAERGWRVCVLERGRRFGPGDYPDRPEQAPRMFWHRRHNPDGMFEPRETPAEPQLPKVRAFDAMAANAGRTPSRLPIAVYFGAPRRHPFSGAYQQGCENLGRCDIGCPRLAKNTVDITYVARAETYGAEVYPLHEATRIEPPPRAGESWRVRFRDLRYGIDGDVRAPVLVLAAGTLGSTRLLLRNRRRLPRLSPALGTRFSGNGDALALAFDPAAEGVGGARAEFGPTMTSRLDYQDERGFMVADGGLPANFGGLLEIVRGVRAITGLGRVRLAAKNVAARVGLSDRELSPRDVHLNRRLKPIGDTLVFLMIGRDAADGRMRLTPLLRCFDIRWSKQGSAKLFDGMRRAAGELAQAAGATSFFALDAGPLGKFITVHPLGGCPMSDDPATGVVDQWGRVHGYHGLYVLDGSIVPTAIGVNPSKTIAALAERGVEHLLAERAP